ncbi:MAG: Gfo/Idh/MocA family oxidoreductase [Candidatus Eisenbacteria bacterium]
MKEVRFGLAGVGRHGARYAHHLLHGDIPGARLTAICRRDPASGRETAKEWRVAFHEDVRALARDPSVDALLVVTPAARHPEAVEAAAEARKPVLVEKPLARDLASCDRIALAAEHSGIDVMVAQTTRYEGPIRGLLDALPEIGPVREVLFSLRSEDRTHEKGAFSERLDDGGAVLDSGVHYFDLLPFLIGPVALVWCERHFVRGTPIDDAYTAFFRSRSGARAVVDMSRWGSSRHEAIQVVGEEGILLVSRTPPSLEKVTGRRREAVPFPDVPGTLVPTLLDFLRVCRGEGKPPITIADGRAAVALAEACIGSRGARVRLG